MGHMNLDQRKRPPLRSQRLVPALVLCLAATACDSGKSDGDTDLGSSDDGVSETGDAAFFTPEERSTILAWLGSLPAEPPPSPSNAFADDPGAASLGQALFFDTAFSSNGAVSCATCHDPATGFSDTRANTSEGLGYTDRSSMSILNGAYGAAAETAAVWQFWDGRCDSQWAQALLPIESPVEMGGSRSSTVLHIYDNYQAEYEAVFGPLPNLRAADQTPLVDPGVLPGDGEWEQLPAASQDAVNEVFANFGKAIEAYERRLISRNSRFDDFWNELDEGAADSDALTDFEKEGLRVFIDQGRCLGCHSGANFTDGQFHNVAVPQVGDNVPASDVGRAEGLPFARDHEFNCAGRWSDHPSKSECAVSQLAGAQGEAGAFKTPSLRSISLSPPYMHTGGFPTLDQVVSHYAIGGAPAGAFEGTRDELMRPLTLDLPERQALPDTRMFLDIHLVPGLFMPNGCMASGGSALNWFVDTLAAGERDAAQGRGP